MWEWLLAECKKIVNRFPENVLPMCERDDVVSNVILSFLECPDKAKKIYDNKESALLRKILIDEKNRLYALKSFEKHQDFSRYNKIESVCTEFGLAIREENAYAISYILNIKEFSIKQIISILRKKKPDKVSYEMWCDSQQANEDGEYYI